MSDSGWLISGSDAKVVLPQGATLDRALFQWGTKASESAAFVPVDCSGMTARTQVRHSAASEEVLLDLTTENAGMSLNSDGFISYAIAAEEAAALPVGTHVYETEIYSGEIVYKFAKGDFVVPREIVRDD
jgi:hypothetical protein